MIISIKDCFKLIGVMICAFCAVLVCSMFISYGIDLKSVEPLIQPEYIPAYEAISMSGKVTCLAGQSAVGKSSLLNALFDLGLETGGLSRKTERGRHTTRRAEMMAVDGMFVLDTPGFSLLELEPGIDPQDFAQLYPEYNALAGECRFQPCLHDREPGCAVHAAVDAGELGAERWQRYRELLAQVRENWKGRYE